MYDREVFNEGDMVSHFDAAKVVEWTKKYDTTRLVDTNSGGSANNLHVGDVNGKSLSPNLIFQGVHSQSAIYMV